MTTYFELEPDATRCVLCGEEFKLRDEIAEMYDPDADESLVGMGEADGVVHVNCGISRGWEMS